MPGIWDHKIQIWKREYKISVSKAIKDIKVGNKTLREKIWKTVRFKNKPNRDSRNEYYNHWN